MGIVRVGEDHGWNVLEGFRPHSDRFESKDARHVPPVFAYSHRVGPSVTGGFVYRGKKQPTLVGKYLFEDFETRRVWALEQRDRKLISIVEIGRSPDLEIAHSFGRSAADAKRGDLYIVGLDHGLIYHIDASQAVWL